MAPENRQARRWSWSALVAVATFAVGIAYLAIHVTLLAQAGASSANIARNVLGDPGKHLFHILLLPPAVLMLTTAVVKSGAGASPRSKRVLLGTLVVLVGLCGYTAWNEHATALRTSMPTKPAVPLKGHSNPCYISDHDEPSIRAELVRFDAWARDEEYPAPAVIKVRRTSGEERIARFDTQDEQETDLAGAYCLLFSGAATRSAPDEAAERRADFASLTWDERAIERGATPPRSLAGLLGPLTSAMAAAFLIAFVAWLFWLWWERRTYSRDPDQIRVHLSIVATYLIFSSWILLGAISAQRTRYFIPTVSYPFAMIVIAFLIVTGLTVRATRLALKIPGWLRLSVGGGSIVLLLADLFISSGALAAVIAKRICQASLPLQSLLYVILVGAIALAIRDALWPKSDEQGVDDGSPPGPRTPPSGAPRPPTRTNETGDLAPPDGPTF